MHDRSTAPDEPLAYSPEQAAALLGVHERTIRKYVAAGVIPSKRLGTRWLIPADALRDWLKAKP